MKHPSGSPASAERAAALGVELGSGKLSITEALIQSFTGTTVAVEYRTLPGNQPNTYGNFIALWQDTTVPWSAPPLKSEKIPGDTPSGSLIVTGVTITKNAYTIGYGVGPEIGDICASASIQPGGQTTAPKSLTISLGYVGSNSLLVHYETLPGYQPQANRNWVGLWQGHASPYNAAKPLGWAKASSDSNVGDIAINGVPLGINTPYTVIYFMGKDTTTAAAILNFNTSDFDGAMAAAPAPVSFRFEPRQ